MPPLIVVKLCYEKTIAHDSKPHHASVPMKHYASDPGAFDEAKKEYYKIVDWLTDVPSKEKLAELGLGWVIPHIYG